MPDIPIVDEHQKVTAWLSVTGDYKPGDMPPGGYCDRQEWARVQLQAGLRQVNCNHCGLFRFPQQLSRTETRTYQAYATKRDAMNEENPIDVTEPYYICHKCAEENQ